jgi:transposase
VAHTFAFYDRDQQFLMPPSVRDWLPDDHLAFFVLDIVEQFDLAAFHARYHLGGAGRAAYDPKMLLGVLLYGYCVGERSSRALERRCTEDVAFRVVAANQVPDHATIARFRAEHEQAIAMLFSQGLALCAKAGLVKVGLVAIDGTKIAASASGAANHTAGGIETVVERILAEAKATDEAEDELYGDRRGDELPAEFARREGRLQRLRELKAELDAEDARRRADKSAKKATVNTTDPDSRIMKTPQGFVQGYNAQVAVTEDQIVLAAAVAQDASDVRQFVPMLEAAIAAIEQADVDEPIETVVADAGYFSERNAALSIGPDLLIAPVSQRRMRDGAVPADPIDTRTELLAADHAEARRRAKVIARWDAGELGFRDAAAAMGLSVPQAYVMRTRYRAHGRDGLRSRRTLGRQTQERPSDQMLAKLLDEPGRSTYAKRSRSVEPIFGQIKEVRGIRRFMRRGLAATNSEWKLIAATHNLLKLWRSGWLPMPRPRPTIPVAT